MTQPKNAQSNAEPTNKERDHASSRRGGKTKRRPSAHQVPMRYASHEEQLREILEYGRRCDRDVAEALVDVLTHVPPRVLSSIGVLLDFVRREVTRDDAGR